MAAFNPSDTNNLIANRRSVYPKQYNGKPVADAIVEQMLENANWAPTHGRTEPWRFVVFTGKGLEQLADLFQRNYKENTPAESYDEGKYEKQRESILQSSHVIAIIMKRQEIEKIPEVEEVCAVACAVQNMWLTATAYGIGSYWSSPGVLDLLAKFAGIPENQKCLGLYFMGYHDAPEAPARRTPMENKITWA